MATGGDDGCLSVWDLRLIQKTGGVPQHGGFSFRNVTAGSTGAKSLITLPAHSHWVIEE